MTIVKWYEPVDSWMRDVIASDITSNLGNTLGERIAAAMVGSILWRADRAEPDAITMYTLEMMISKLDIAPDFLRKQARTTSKYIVDLSEPHEYGYYIDRFLSHVREVTKKAIDHFMPLDGTGYMTATSSIIGFFNENIDPKITNKL